MKIEVRADGLHISGYVNVTGKLSRPVITPRGKVLETIEERAFSEAISKSGDITVQLDHDSGHAYARTSDGTLKLREDAIGLHADVLITDKTLIEIARKGKLRGWSFGMFNVQDDIESRGEGELPVRHVRGLMLDHVSLIKDLSPCYAATSVECRGGDTVDVETRSLDIPPQLTVEKPDFSAYEERIRKLDEG